MIEKTNLLLNVFVVLMPLFLYQLFWLDRVRYSKRNNVIIITLFSALSQIFAMLFPFGQVPNIDFDFRLIPGIIGTLLGGSRTACVLSIVFITQRSLVHTPGYSRAVIYYLIVLGVALSVRKYYKKQNVIMRVAISCSIIFIAVTFLAIGIAHHRLHQTSTVHFLELYVCFNVVIIGFVTIFIDNMFTNIKLREKLNQHEKFAVLGELSAAFAHEIRNPLTVIRGFTQLLAADGSLSEKNHEHLSLVQGEIERIEEVTNYYLAFSKADTETTQHIDVSQEIQKVTHSLETLSEERLVGIHTENYTICNPRLKCADKAVYVVGNPKAFLQALINITKNAVEASSPGGIISLSVTQSKNHVMIEIHDTGRGMTDHEVSMLGNPHYSITANGTGLGLMVSYRVIQAMKGTIEVTSKLHKGTTVRVTLPRI